MKRTRDPKILARSLAVLTKRLAVCAAVLPVFAILQKYIPQNTTYEYTGPSKNPDKPQTVMQSNKDTSLYTLRLENGEIGVYRSDGTLEYTAGIDPLLLTDYDRELLTSGICATRDEIDELIGELLS